jgi:hypothetical protein
MPICVVRATASATGRPSGTKCTRSSRPDPRLEERSRRFVEEDRRAGVALQDEAGCRGLTSPARHSFTARALRASGTTQRISRDFRICWIDMEIAARGTSSRP